MAVRKDTGKDTGKGIKNDKDNQDISKHVKLKERKIHNLQKIQRLPKVSIP